MSAAIEDQLLLRSSETWELVDERTMLDAKRCLIDWLGLAIYGAREPLVQILLRSHAQLAGGSRIMGLRGARFQASDAALINGAASHSTDYDDTNHLSLVHISSTLFPALFAFADRHDLTGMDVLRSFVMGYEAEYRIGRYISRGLIQRGWHPTAVLGHIGSSLCVALALRLPAEQAKRALGISGVLTSGMIAAFGTMSKPLQVGRAAADGLYAVLLAEQGFTGPEHVLSMKPGWTEPMLDAWHASWDEVWENWGQPFAVQLNSLKPYPSCLMTHPPIDAARELHRQLMELNQSAADIDTIECYVCELAPHVAGHMAPSTGLQGKFSVAFCCVTALLTGNAVVDDFRDEWVQSPDVQHVLSKLKMTVRKDISEQQAEMIIKLKDGRTLKSFTKMAKGNPENPLTNAEVERKFKSLVKHHFQGKGDSIIERLWHFESEPSAAQFTTDLQHLY